MIKTDAQRIALASVVLCGITFFGLHATFTPSPLLLNPASALVGDCSKAKNTCPSYAPSWAVACPQNARCIEFHNSCATQVSLSYQVGCNGDGTPGAPQCGCSAGPILAPAESAFWIIEDAAYSSCLPSWTPPCLTAGLAVLINPAPTCATGTRIEFSAGNSLDPYGRFDSYDIDVEKASYTLPVSFVPDIACAHDVANHDCRSLYCGDSACPNAYLTPTTGGCSDGRSPQVGCQDTFNEGLGYRVEVCPPVAEPCADASPCPPSE